MKKTNIYIIIFTVISLFSDVINQKNSDFHLINEENLNTDLPINENAEEIKEIDIFIHGTADGIAHYAKHLGTSPTLEGLWNHIKSKLLNRKNNLALYSNTSKFGDYKNRKENILKKDFPTLMGITTGLSEIQHHFDDCSHQDKCNGCIAPIAFDYILVPFKNNKKQCYPGNHKSYMFNWVGNLSSQDRKIAARQFNKDFNELSKKYPHAKKNIYTHSHGGNVLLEAANLKSLENINYVIFLAMPIGKKTAELTKKITCKKIYNIYSNTDTAQNKDISFDIKTTFIGRKIPENNDTVKNIKIERKDKKIVHHGTFNIVDIKNKIYPVICDIPLLLYYLEHNTVKSGEKFLIEDYIYTIT
jgi:hypothetical protein